MKTAIDKPLQIMLWIKVASSTFLKLVMPSKKPITKKHFEKKTALKFACIS